jgi:hypothetical protein
MFAVYTIDSGELTYLCEEDGLEHMPPSQYGWVEFPADLDPFTWRQTHFWNAGAKSFDQINPE